MKHIQIVSPRAEAYLIGCVFEVEDETPDLYIVKKYTKHSPDAIRKRDCIVLSNELSECEPYIRLLLARTKATLNIYQLNDDGEVKARLAKFEELLESFDE